MAPSPTNPNVDFYFIKAKKWQKEIELLRSSILASGLIEELKWGVPCYTLNSRNVLLIHTFKDYCAVLFFKGVLMKDSKSILVQQTKNVQAGRQIRFTSVEEIVNLKATLQAYIREAIAIEKAGLEVTFKKTEDYEMTEEFRKRLDTSSALRDAFDALTPGRRRAYLLYFSSAKQATTREARIEKCIDLIMDGMGLEVLQKKKTAHTNQK